jgi:uncharacterized protein (DUF302 family)
MNVFEAVLPADLTTTEEAMRAALGAQGFGVVSEIDVAANLKNATGVERPPLKILGACSPALVQEALALDDSVSVLLPCNVVLDLAGSGTRVRIVDPKELMADPRFSALAQGAADGLRAALVAVEKSVGSRPATG